jgi:hypothetical protein
MTNHPALLALMGSLERDSCTPCTWRPDREAYIEEETDSLRRRVVQAPYEVRAVASDWAQEFCAQPSTVRTLVAVAQSGEQWLLFDPASGTFAKAFGRAGQPEPLSLLGFESADALAEWLG